MKHTDALQVPMTGGWHAAMNRTQVHATNTAVSVSWACHQNEVREAQRLRHQVLAVDMGARLSTPVAGHDIDLFDDFCEHLMVRDAPGGRLIGTCRVLTPAQARRVGSTCADTAFDLTRLRGVRERMVEVGRVCVHHDHRHGGAMPAIWHALGRFMARNGLDTVIGCVSLPLHQDGRVAASVWRQVRQRHLAPIDRHVRPRLPLPLDRLDDSLDAEPPALIKSCLRLGAKVLGPPAWNPDFNSADLPMLLRLSDMPVRYRQRLLEA